MCRFHNRLHRRQCGESAGLTFSAGSKYRLPRHVLPIHQELELTPDYDNLTFFGRTVIDIDVLKSTSEIIINAKELTFGTVSVMDDNGTELTASVRVDTELQRAHLNFAGKLGKGKWKLSLNFAGILNDELKGFYRSIWEGVDGKSEKQIFATTQFEATDARRAFPCFDEPNLKLTFKLVMNVPHEFVVLSAMRPVSESTISVESPADLAVNGAQLMQPRLLKRVEFPTTPKMSTYYFSFVAGPLAYGGSVKALGVDLAFWSPKGTEHQLEFAKEVAARAFVKLDEYCQTRYIGDTLINFVAMPDFEAGAMENLGNIIYRMTDILIDLATATHAEKVRVAHVITHELVHMRFGDDATMDDWDGLWLNESFATLLENMIVDEMFPEWKTWESFAEDRASAFGLDQLHSTHPIQVPVENPFQIDEIFDLIAYEKGCSVLRMLEQFIGYKAFRDGVRIYLKRHHLSNTVTEDLWTALDEGCVANGVKVSVRKLMDGWIYTAGHPIVQVDKSDKPGFIKLSQKEFKVLDEGMSPTLWPVPVKLRAKCKDGIIEQQFVFTDREALVFIGEGMEWVVVNAYGDGFFRVAYDSTMLGKLLPVVKTAMGPVERYNLLNDAWSATRARLMKVTDYLKLVDTFQGDEDPNIWSRIAGSLTYLHTVLEGPAKVAVEGKVRALFTPLHDKLGTSAVDGESSKRMELRTQVMRTLAMTGKHQAIILKAREVFGAWKKDPTSVHGDIFDASVDIVSATGDVNHYNEFDALRLTAATPQDKERFQSALTSFEDKELVERSLKLVLGGGIRTQDAAHFLASLLAGDKSAAITWASIKENWAQIKDMWPESLIARLFGGLRALDTPEQEADVKAFFAANPVTTMTMKLAQGLEQLRINVLLRQAVKAEEAEITRVLLPSGVESCMSPNVDETAGDGKDAGQVGATKPAESAAPQTGNTTDGTNAGTAPAESK